MNWWVHTGSLLARSTSRCFLEMVELQTSGCTQTEQEFTMWINNIDKSQTHHLFPSHLGDSDPVKYLKLPTSTTSHHHYRVVNYEFTLTSKLLDLMLSRIPGWLGAEDLLLTDADVLTGARRAALLLFTALWLAANQRRPSLNQPIRERDSHTLSAWAPPPGAIKQLQELLRKRVNIRFKTQTQLIQLTFKYCFVCDNHLFHSNLEKDIISSFFYSVKKWVLCGEKQAWKRSNKELERKRQNWHKKRS